MSYSGMVVDLLSGLAVSVEIFVLTLAVALPLGLVVALGRMSKSLVVSGLFRLYISVVRGTPLMLQIIFVYFAPYFMFGMPLASYPRLLATVIAFGLNYGAYFAEIYRGGILAVDRGQHEAATALGLSRAQTFFRIIREVYGEPVTEDVRLAVNFLVGGMIRYVEEAVNMKETPSPDQAVYLFRLCTPDCLKKYL